MITADTQKQRATWTRSFAAATWLIARGFEIEGVELARDGSGGAVFKFSSEASAHLEDFHRAKDRLNAMALAARAGR